MYVGTAMPMVTGRPGSRMPTVQVTVASVGPYVLSMRRPGAHRSTSSEGHASPPTMRPRIESIVRSTVDSTVGTT